MMWKKQSISAKLNTMEDGGEEKKKCCLMN